MRLVQLMLLGIMMMPFPLMLLLQMLLGITLELALLIKLLM